ncbi:MAG: hypothetical protein QN834_07145 [Nitrososphaeraceae archaeon]|nr:hypothetical protein [Nitrososphaeraceae archaeon]
MNKTIQTKAGTLTILDECNIVYGKKPKNYAAYKIKCYCNKIFVVRKLSITRGLTTSCGCYHKENLHNIQFIHGHSVYVNGKPKPTKTYHTWVGIKSPCLYKNHKSYLYYGGKGIILCEKWQTFSGFLEDMGEKPLGHRLTRIDKSGDFEPDNCEWVPIKTRIKK